MAPNALEHMIDRMNRTSSPAPAFPPPRTSSRASSRTRLSTHSSARSLHSVRSVSPRPASPLARPSLDEAPDETTPVVQQGEWTSAAISHSRARTTSDDRGLQRNHEDDTSSLRSSRSKGPEGEANGSNPFYASPAAPIAAHTPRWSPRKSPPPRIRRPGSSSSSTSPPPNPFASAAGQSPLRLLPRSPLNDRAPLEDLAFLREAGAFSDEDQFPILDEIKSRTENDTSSIHSSNSASIRNARLREDIEQTAQRIKDRASAEDVARARASTPAESAAPSTPVANPDPNQPVARRGSSGFASSLPLYPGAPLPAAPLHSPASEPTGGYDARSLHSGTSEADSGKSWQVPHHGGVARGARSEFSEAKGDRTARVRQKESKEWSQACWIWVQDKGSDASVGGSSSGGGKFSKTPLIRDVPSVMKRKSGKRESSHHLLSPAEAMLFNFDDASGSSRNSKSSSSRSSSSRDKPKSRSAFGIGPGERDGGWRRATGVLRDDGSLRISGEADKIVMRSIHLPSYNRTDVRILDHSLFGRPNCVSISRRTATPATPFRSSFASVPMSTSLSSESPRPDEPIYLCFPSIVATQVWLVMAHCFAGPEYYLAAGSAPPPPVPSRRKTREPNWSSSDEEETREGEADELSKSCRIFRKLQITINEGRALGETMSETMRSSAKSSWDRPELSREGSNNGDGYGKSSELQSPGALDSPNRSIASSLAYARPRTGEGKDDHSGTDWCCEIEMDGEIVARTATRRGRSPFWNESFTFSDLPPFFAPITIRVLQATKSSSRHQVLGCATVRVPDLPRHELCEDWWSIKPVNPAKGTDVVGELNLGVRVAEEIVLPSRGYETILKLLTEDIEADLAIDIAHEFPSDLEEMTTILLRIYQAESILVPRLMRLAELEVDNNDRLNRAAAILFRGNTILTKSVELYLRLIGAEYLEASIGDAVRKIIKDKVEIEIDPLKLKSGWRDKDLLANVHALHEWSTYLWNSIYDAREKCPQDLRQIFGHIQRVVVEKYGQGDDQKNTRWTSVSAFVFLRFFVPAVLNPRLFFIVSSPPDTKSQRTLTLIAKTLQGLANFSSFGQKEPWMLPMNSFVQDNGAAFVDFIEHVATPASATAYRQEWTSSLASTYLAPYRLRNSLSPLAKEGVPLLPHLIDLPRELGLFATHLARWSLERASLDQEGSVSTGRSGTPSVASSRGGSSQRFLDLAEACSEVHEESWRRGGGLISALSYYDLRLKQPELRTRAGSRMTGRPATSSGAYGPGVQDRAKSLGIPPPRPPPISTGDELLHIRNPLRASTPPPRAMLNGNANRPDEDATATTGHKAERRSHRSVTINGTSPGRTVPSAALLKSISSEDLSALAAISTRPSIDSLTSRTPVTGSGGTLPQRDAPPLRVETGAREIRNRLLDSGESPLSEDASYHFPNNPRSIGSVPMNQASSTHSSSTGSTASGSHFRLPTTTRIRITQETTVSTTHVSHQLAPLGNSVSVSAPQSGYQLGTPTSPELTTPYPHESQFGGLSFVGSPSRSAANSAISSPIQASRSQPGYDSLPSSTSSMSISAEVSAPPISNTRRTSSAGIFGLGKSSKGPIAADDDSSGGSSGGIRGGLLSRAMGRKGSRH
ncbi:uncharacterized protein JCM15063_004985 [Sporobolomyces koalae]|uniref:uncharacterized protein n=1 Tax=Sporobolomyces koalae TaxID=500713 RepID=UPI00317D0428